MFDILYGVFYIDSKGLEKIAKTGRGSGTPAVYTTLSSARAVCTRFGSRYRVRKIMIGEVIENV